MVAKFAYRSKCGYCPDKKNKVNQDTFIAKESFMEKGKYLFGVCDGHGSNGHYVSEFIREILPENIEYWFLKSLKSHNPKSTKQQNISQCLTNSFLKTSKNLL